MISNPQSNYDSARLLKIILHFGFLVSGIVTVLIGQILPILSARLALDDTHLGYFFIAQFAGSLLGTLLTSVISKHLGFVGATIIGFAMMTLGVFGLNADSWILCLFAFIINGVGTGITLPAINMLTVELNPENVTPALNFLNFFWGIGAIFCKPFIDFFGSKTSIYQPTLILCGLLLLIGAIIFFVPHNVEHRQNSTAETGESLPPIWSTPLAWAIAFFNFVHVGFESGASGWITTYAARFPAQNEQPFWISPISLYFLFFIAGRGIAPFYSRFLRENMLILLGLGLMTIGMLVSLLGNTYLLLIIGSGISGFGTAAIFPTNMARFTKIFGGTATRRATPMFVGGILGSALITFAIGYISSHFNDLRVGMFVLLGGCVLLLTLQILLMLNPKVKN